MVNRMDGVTNWTFDALTGRPKFQTCQRQQVATAVVVRKRNVGFMPAVDKTEFQRSVVAAVRRSKSGHYEDAEEWRGAGHNQSPRS